MSSFQSKWMGFSPETLQKRTDKTDESPSVSFVSSISRHCQEKKGKQAGHSWQNFYPDLAPADFEITEMTEGIGGRKIRGAMVGTVGFFIPRGKLKQGPPTKRKGRTREEWDFSRLHIPSQTDPGNVDVWMVARRLDSQGWKFWFLKRGHP